MTQLKIDPTWNLEAMFPSVDAWESEFKALSSDLREISSFEGTLANSPETLLDVLEKSDETLARASRLRTYASLLFASDTRDDDASKLDDRGSALEADVETAQAFIVPEILEMGIDKIEMFFRDFPGLRPYRFLFDEIERLRPHVRNRGEEEVIVALSPLRTIAGTVHTALNDSDLKFASLRVGGNVVDLNQGNFDDLIASPDRAVRRASFENFADQYIAHKHTFSTLLSAQAQSSFRFAEVRRYRSTLEETLNIEEVPESVFTTVLEVCSENRPLLQRYFSLKARILGLDRIAEYDIHAPLGKNPPVIPFEQGVEMVLDALAPLGEEYQEIARRGLCEERWADVYAKPGKFSNAFSSGTYGTSPYLLLNYSDRMQEVGTLAHELGHSMHSLRTNRTQPFCFTNYSMLVAETASNLNQVLLRDKLFKSEDREVVLAGFDEAFLYIHRYLFLFPTLTEVEHFVHSQYAARKAVGADELCQKTVEAFSAAYGDSVEFDEERLGMRWAPFCHLYDPYYIFQYGVGISAAMAIGQRILAGDTRVRDQYLKFLDAGASMPVVDIFKLVDIDITSPEPYRAAFALVKKYLDRLEELAS